jgi:hypothetical protein
MFSKEKGLSPLYIHGRTLLLTWGPRSIAGTPIATTKSVWLRIGRTTMLSPNHAIIGNLDPGSGPRDVPELKRQRRKCRSNGHPAVFHHMADLISAPHEGRLTCLRTCHAGYLSVDLRPGARIVQQNAGSFCQDILSEVGQSAGHTDVWCITVHFCCV